MIKNTLSPQTSTRETLECDLPVLSATILGIFVGGQISTLNSSEVILYANIGQEGTVKGTYFEPKKDEICTAL